MLSFAFGSRPKAARFFFFFLPEISSGIPPTPSLLVVSPVFWGLTNLSYLNYYSCFYCFTVHVANYIN
jgi:hypothetical protein